jgi:hypothetical protein
MRIKAQLSYKNAKKKRKEVERAAQQSKKKKKKVKTEKGSGTAREMYAGTTSMLLSLTGYDR